MLSSPGKATNVLNTKASALLMETLQTLRLLRSQPSLLSFKIYIKERKRPKRYIPFKYLNSCQIKLKLMLLNSGVGEDS